MGRLFVNMTNRPHAEKMAVTGQGWTAEGVNGHWVEVDALEDDFWVGPEVEGGLPEWIEPGSESEEEDGEDEVTEPVVVQPPLNPLTSEGGDD